MRPGFSVLAPVFLFSFFAIVPLIQGKGLAFQETGRSGNAVFYSARLNDIVRSVCIVKPRESVPINRLVVIFPGYCPEGDPYDQSAGSFLKRWDLSSRADRTGSVFVICGMRDSLYPLTRGRVGSRDLGFIAEILKSGILPRPGTVPTVFIGISTGVEGAVKYLSRFPGPRPAVLIALSGTWDYAGLPESGGEYRIHQKVFGSSVRVWEKESPLKALDSAVKRDSLTVHAFSEERSLFREQMLRLAGVIRPGLTVRVWPEFGNGRTHGWNFWSDDGLTEKIFSIAADVR